MGGDGGKEGQVREKEGGRRMVGEKQREEDGLLVLILIAGGEIELEEFATYWNSYVFDGWYCSPLPIAPFPDQLAGLLKVFHTVATHTVSTTDLNIALKHITVDSSVVFRYCILTSSLMRIKLTIVTLSKHFCIEPETAWPSPTSSPSSRPSSRRSARGDAGGRA